jgi:hypothetical protein
VPTVVLIFGIVLLASAVVATVLGGVCPWLVRVLTERRPD